MSSSRIARYVESLTEREYQDESRRYQLREVYAEIVGWGEFLSEAIECQLENDPPRPPYHCSHRQNFAEAYNSLNARARSMSLSFLTECCGNKRRLGEWSIRLKRPYPSSGSSDTSRLVRPTQPMK